MRIRPTAAFKRAYKKKVRTRPQVSSELETALTLFRDNPFDLRLETHKLHGRLQGFWSFSVAKDLRVVFLFEGDDSVAFLDFGTHDEVY